MQKENVKILISQELAQSKRKSLPKTKIKKKLNRQSRSNTKRTYSKLSEQLFSYVWALSYPDLN